MSAERPTGMACPECHRSTIERVHGEWCPRCRSFITDLKLVFGPDRDKGYIRTLARRPF